MTILGPRATSNSVGNSLFLAAAQIRRNSTISIFNSIIAGWPKGLLIDASKGVPTDLSITGSSPSLFIQNTIIAGCKDPVAYAASSTAATGTTSATIRSWFTTGSYANTILTNNEEAGLTAPFNYASPDFNPTTNSLAVSGAGYTNNRLAGFQRVTYKGACAPADTWWKGWTKY